MSVKDKIKEKDGKEFALTAYEFKYIKELNVLLQFHIAKNQVISGFLTYVAQTRLGYTKIKEGHNLQYEIDLDKDEQVLKIREMPIATQAQ